MSDRDEHVQLYTEVDGETGAKLILDDHYAMQEKFDGHRVQVEVTASGAVNATKRKGTTRQISKDIQAEIKTMLGPGSRVDGELVMNRRLYVFDILFAFGDDLREMPFEQRAELVSKMTGGRFIFPAKTAFTREAKIAMAEELHTRRAEGMIFKKKKSPYRIRRQKDQFKHKFLKTASVIVSAINEKRSVQIVVLDDRGDKIDLCDLSIPVNKRVPKVDSIIEVRYSYAYPNHHLVQAVYLFERDDIDREECGLSQIRHKQTFDW
jgi:bifunctional non-homologous end joining protein LigD